MFKLFRKHIEVLTSIIGVVVLTFIVGVYFGFLGLPPASTIAKAHAQLRGLLAEVVAYVGLQPVGHLAPLRFDFTGVGSQQKEKSIPGVKFLVSIFNNKFTARLYSQEGELLHEWPVDFFTIDYKGKAYRYHSLIHGAALFPNGDFVANLDGSGLYRISACGEVLWSNTNRSHHSVFIDDSGFIWTAKKSEQYSSSTLFSSPFSFDSIGKFDSSTGKLVDEIDLVDVLTKSQMEGLVLTANTANLGDVMHLNDVEILSADMAEAFEQFNAGDIMLSSRHFNQIWILDGSTHELKWWITGPMVAQHDPDFQPDGTITVLDNRPSGYSSPENKMLGRLGGSRILKIDPVSRHIETLYSSSEKSTFYTPYRGKHQIIENGNIVLAETDSGRAMEVTKDGEIVWEFVNSYNDTQVAWMMDAIHYPESHKNFINTSMCNG